ncbi:MAG: hypothetical protein QXF46_06960 [Thermofilaceae archaeon]
MSRVIARDVLVPSSAFLLVGVLALLFVCLFERGSGRIKVNLKAEGLLLMALLRRVVGGVVWAGGRWLRARVWGCRLCRFWPGRFPPRRPRQRF